MYLRDANGVVIVKGADGNLTHDSMLGSIKCGRLVCKWAVHM